MASSVRSVLLNILHFPLTRIILGMAVFIAVPALFNKWVLKPFLGGIIPNESAEQIVRWTISIFLVIILYVVLFSIYERRRVSEFALRYAGEENIIGFVVGGLLVGSIILVLLGSGSISFTILNPVSIVFKPLILFILLALMEEVIFRGILYRITEQSLGTWIALLISAVLFGVIHITNDHADFLGILGASLAGVMLGVLYTLSGRLWYPLAIHFGWNFFQYFFGLPVSGVDDFQYFMDATRRGPEWFIGGGFGIENSLLTIILISGLSVFLLYRASIKGKIVRPYWKK
jgi:membrane protease YdiL (CAAX protease family)